MSLFAISGGIFSWIATIKMLQINVGANLINNTTSWLAYASWTWEVLRRNPDYISYYKSLRNKGLSEHISTDGTAILRSVRHHPTANKFGLLFPADPTMDAGEQPVFWHPAALKSAVRFHVIDPADIDRKQKPLQLSKFPGHKTHFIDANGTYHIRILGHHYWFQMQCDNLDILPQNAFIGLKMNHLENPDKRLKTFKEIGGIYDGSIALDSGLHVPTNLESHQKATLAYDIRTSGGSILHVISALKETGFIKEDPDNFVDFRVVAQNAYRAGKAYINGDYLKILNKQ